MICQGWKGKRCCCEVNHAIICFLDNFERVGYSHIFIFSRHIISLLTHTLLCADSYSYFNPMKSFCTPTHSCCLTEWMYYSLSFSFLFKTCFQPMVWWRNLPSFHQWDSIQLSPLSAQLILAFVSSLLVLISTWLTFCFSGRWNSCSTSILMTPPLAWPDW